jgi:hypothetical protein
MPFTLTYPQGRFLEHPHKPTFQLSSPLRFLASPRIPFPDPDALPSMPFTSESASSHCISPQDSVHLRLRTLDSIRLPAAVLLLVRIIYERANSRWLRIKIGCASPSETGIGFSWPMAGSCADNIPLSKACLLPPGIVRTGDSA